MLTEWRWLLGQVSRRLWFRATLMALLGVAAATVATFADRFLPDSWSYTMGTDAVDSILTIIASSMLAVTTFSLSTLTNALGDATSNATPRATRLLIQDRVTQNVLSTFVGAFLFSIVGIVALQAQVYGENGRAVLFIVTIGVLGLIVLSLLRWIDHLIQLGRVGETAERVEAVALAALQARQDMPGLGGKLRRSDVPLPAGAKAITSTETGYLVHIDMQKIEKIAAKRDLRIDLAQLPGGFVWPGSPLAWLGTGEPDDELEDCIRAAHMVTATRDYDQDPRFGIIVLGEIASRALSPGINDPGTAIDIIARIARLLSLWGQGGTGASKVIYPHVHVPRLRTEDLFSDGFSALSRDGAGMIEVQMRLLKNLAALMSMGDDEFRQAARRQAELALAHAERALPLEQEKQQLRELMPWLPEPASQASPAS